MICDMQQRDKQSLLSLHMKTKVVQYVPGITRLTHVTHVTHVNSQMFKTSQLKRLSVIYIILGCSCTDYVNRNGIGQCKESSRFQFDNKVSCYVNLPTTCTDKIPSDTDRDKWLSHEACLKKSTGGK